MIRVRSAAVRDEQCGRPPARYVQQMEARLSRGRGEVRNADQVARGKLGAMPLKGRQRAVEQRRADPALGGYGRMRLDGKRHPRRAGRRSGQHISSRNIHAL
jgi:hypothetical protein